MKWLFILFVKVYQNTLGLIFPPSCRYSPTCSVYTIQAITKYGAVKGSWLGFLRILRCNPYSKRHPIDPLI